MKILAAMVTACCLATVAAAQARPSSVSEPEHGPAVRVLRGGAQNSVDASDDHFTGTVRVERLFSAVAPSRAAGGRVTFEPGARTAWHKHPAGQTLIVTAGKGWVQQWGGAIEEMRQGDVVSIPPGVKHWHGATTTTSVTHIAVQESLNGKTVEWMEKVSDEQYGKAKAASGTGAPAPSAAQKMFGDFDPKLAELTDNVLFGDVWERPGLAKRDRSLITVAALIAMNRPEQLKHHLQRARDNGVTQEEIVEAITHLAFYAGWPNAVSAIAVAKEIFR